MADKTIPQKMCSRCKATKPISEFHKNRTNHDGLVSHCRNCIREARGNKYLKPYKETESRSCSAFFTKEELATEEWKSIPGFDDYSISTLGRIESSRSPHYGFKREPRVLKQRKPGPNGYVMIDLRSDSMRCPRTVHPLVLETFVGPCPKGMEACHGDGVRSNNRLSNLRWDTPKNNHLDSVRHGTDNPIGLELGRKPRLFKYSPEQLRWILANRSHYSQRELANLSGVHYSSVRRICQGRYHPDTLHYD